MSLKLNSSGGGSITLQEPSTASNRTLTLPDNTGNLISSADSGTVSQTMLASGVAGNGPAFSAYPSAATQTITASTYTKVAINTVSFDTNSNFNTTNNEFKPTVAGYYQFNASVQVNATSVTRLIVVLYKNGSLATYGTDVLPTSAVTSRGLVSSVLYMNGTTDAVSVYAFATGTGTLQVIGGGPTLSFSGALVRAA